MIHHGCMVNGDVTGSERFRSEYDEEVRTDLECKSLRDVATEISNCTIGCPGLVLTCQVGLYRLRFEELVVLQIPTIPWVGFIQTHT